MAVTSTKIQIKTADNNLLFPRVRTIDLRNSANTTSVFTNDKLEISYIPTVTTVGAVGDDLHVPTEKAVRTAIGEITGALVTGVATVVASNGIKNVPATTSTGNVVVAGDTTLGDGSTLGVVATSEFREGGFNGDSPTLGIPYNSTTWSTVVPTVNTIYWVTSLLTSQISGRIKEVKGIDPISAYTSASVTSVSLKYDTTKTNGVYLGLASNKLVAKADKASTTAYGTAQLAKDIDADDDTVITTNLYNQYKNVYPVGIYPTEGSMIALGSNAWGQYGIVSGGSAAIYKIISSGTGTGLAKLSPTGKLLIDVNTGVPWRKTVNDQEMETGKTFKPTVVGAVWSKNEKSSLEACPLYVTSAGLIDLALDTTSHAGMTIETGANGLFINAIGDAAAGDATKFTIVKTTKQTSTLTAAQLADGTLVPTAGAVSNAIKAAVDGKNVGITAVTAVNGLSATTNNGATVVSGRDVIPLTTITTSTAAAIAAVKGVVHTVNDITFSGMQSASNAAVTVGHIYNATTWATAVSNNVVPTVAAIQNACLFYETLA